MILAFGKNGISERTRNHRNVHTQKLSQLPHEKRFKRVLRRAAPKGRPARHTVGRVGRPPRRVSPHYASSLVFVCVGRITPRLSHPPKPPYQTHHPYPCKPLSSLGQKKYDAGERETQAEIAWRRQSQRTADIPPNIRHSSGQPEGPAQGQRNIALVISQANDLITASAVDTLQKYSRNMAHDT